MQYELNEGPHRYSSWRGETLVVSGLAVEGRRRYDLDEARAFEVLRRYSQDHNVKLRTVAEYLVSTRTLPGPLSGP